MRSYLADALPPLNPLVEREPTTEVSVREKIPQAKRSISDKESISDKGSISDKESISDKGSISNKESISDKGSISYIISPKNRPGVTARRTSHLSK